jgi:SAM-dependent methyltransferase
VAWELDDRYYDGERANGYGGFKDDCRWDSLTPQLYKKFGINLNGTILDIGCKKGFILESFKRFGHLGKLIGIENHPYPLTSLSNSSGIETKCGPYYDIPVANNSADFLIAFSSIYMQTLGDVVRSLREIQRVSDGRSYITLGAFEGEADRKIFSQWTLIGTTVLSIQDWHEVMDYSGYTGSYFFTTPAVLGLS